MDKNFLARLRAAADLAQTTIGNELAGAGNAPVVQAMRHATIGGKCLRAFLVVESANLFNITSQTAAPAAAAIEAMHAYSLVHDDLPAMDDDDLRRGRPTVHLAFDQATAILAGDALQALAFELLAGLDIPDRVKVEIMSSLARAAGVRGMVGGQAMDIAAESAATKLTLDEISRLQNGKTGALFRWAATSGARMAGVDNEPLDAFARAFGLAFQIADDILDATGDEIAAGKRLQKDATAKKATFVSLLGLNAARQKALGLIDLAKDALEPYGNKADALKAAADFVVLRDH